MAQPPKKGVNPDDYMVIDMRDVTKMSNRWVSNEHMSQQDARVNLALHEREAEVRAQEARNTWHAITFGLGVLATFIAGHIISLRVKYVEAFSWYKKQYTKGPRPESSISFSIWCLCIAIEYQSLFMLVNAVFACKSVHRQTAQFLLIMIQHFGSELEGIHWAGSPTQLHHNKLSTTFVKDYAGWSDNDNVFRFLLPSQQAFQTSVAVQAAQKELAGSVLDSLFSGGLCRVGFEHASATVSATDLARDLLARRVVLHRTCAAEKRAKAVNAGFNGMSNTVSGALGGTMVIGVLDGAGSISAASGVGGTLGAIGSAATTGGFQAVGGGLATAISTVTTPLFGIELSASSAGGPIGLCIGVFAVLGTLIGIGIAAAVGGGAHCDGGDYYVIGPDGKPEEFERGKGMVPEQSSASS